MTTSQFDSKNLKRRSPRQVFLPRMATWVMLSILAFAGAIASAWFAGEKTIGTLFSQLHFWQQNPPWWLEAPENRWEYLLAPTAALFFTAIAAIKLSPKPRLWSQTIVVSIVLALTIRYVIWRSLSTLNLADPLNGVFSLLLFFLEILAIFAGSIQLFLTVRAKDRRRQADRMSVAVFDGSFTPSVDILIPTYNEPDFILRRTIVGCQALDYANKKIYLLDDTRRPEIKRLAEKLGCEYVTRSDNTHAKAGNLNHAIAQTTGELIVVFDADFVPTTNFLTRTIGFFQDPTIALLQTHQSFYNFDAIARNLGLENVITHEPEEFYRRNQPIRDGAGSTICAGTSFVVRRAPLEAIGGFVPESLSEDYFTGIRLSALGLKVIYLDENLSAGLAAETMAEHVAQRLRWARGTIQAFFVKANPLTIPGLTLRQRLAHLEGLLYWFTSLSRIGFLTIPLAYSFLGIVPVGTTLVEWLYFFLPYYLVNLSVFAWLSHRSRSTVISEILSVAQCFPIAATVIHTLFSPFSKEFRVTSKGIVRDRLVFNWALARPLIVIGLASLLGLWRTLEFMSSSSADLLAANPELAQQAEFLGLGLFWSGYNLFIIIIALISMLDIPKPDNYEWIDWRRKVRMDIGEKTFWGVTTMISEGGAEITLTQSNDFKNIELQPVFLEIIEENLHLKAEMNYASLKEEFPTVRVTFQQVSLSQYRHLVEMLFCRPGQWKRQEAPGEWRSLWLLLKILFRPPALFDRNKKTIAIAVSQF